MSNTKTAVNENQLIVQAVSGNPEAFGQLVREYQDRLFTTVIHIVHCRADAEDIVQDAFVQAYVKLGSFKGKSSFYTWLYRIAVNMALSRGRRMRARRSVERPREGTGEEPHDPNGSPSERLEREEHAGEIRIALESLSEEHRAILVLRGVEGFDYETIAQILNLSPGTVRSRLHRARTQLREQLDQSHCCYA
jgi:RNA polymerase sigma-70 factor (ECF subfamily)